MSSTRPARHAPRLAAVVLLAAAAAGCSSPASAPAAAGQSSAPAAAASPAGQPETAAAARTAAQQFFALYAAGQFDAAWPMLAPAARAVTTQATWAAVHAACTSSTSGLSYAVGAPVMAGGTNAVMKVSLAGAASAIGSEEVTFTYSGGAWGWLPTPAQLAPYKGATTVAQVVAREKAAGNCD